MHTGLVDLFREVMVIGMCVLVVVAAVGSLVFVWRDDHRGADR